MFGKYEVLNVQVYPYHTHIHIEYRWIRDCVKMIREGIRVKYSRGYLFLRLDKGSAFKHFSWSRRRCLKFSSSPDLFQTLSFTCEVFCENLKNTSFNFAAILLPSLSSYNYTLISRRICLLSSYVAINI